jgi:hypothetical protein
MRHLKNLTDWLAESTGIARLIELGLADPKEYMRFYFEINTGSLGALWKRLRAGEDDPYPETLDQGGQLRLGWTWIVPRDYDEHNFYETGFHVSTGQAVELDEILRLAHELDHEGFLDQVDEIVHNYLLKIARSTVADEGSSISGLVISTRTGRIRA